MLNKLFLSVFLIVIIFGISAVVGINYFNDPLQYYRYSPYQTLNVNDRWQVAGFIRSFDFDAIILGTSMTQNFSLKLIEKVMHCKPIRLSVAGLSIQEQAIILKASIKTKKVKTVIWGIDRTYLNYEAGKIQRSFPVELYNQPLLGHVNYLINMSTTHVSIKNMIKRPINHQEHSDLEHYNSWQENFVFSKNVVLKQYQEAISKISLQKTEAKHTKLQSNETQIKNFERDVLQIIIDNPDIRFYVFFPPYSLAHHKMTYQSSKEGHMQEANLRKYMLVRLLNLPNVFLYDFETDLKIIANLDNYKDLTHYSKEINDFMVYSFKNREYIIAKDILEKNHRAFLSLPSHPLE